MSSSITAIDWVRLALRRDIVSRSLKVGLVVGTILAAINHGERLLALDLDRDMLLKIILTYLVPYSVSTWASVQAARAALNSS
jgi:hypothetical protein